MNAFQDLGPNSAGIITEKKTMAEATDIKTSLTVLHSCTDNLSMRALEASSITALVSHV